MEKTFFLYYFGPYLLVFRGQSWFCFPGITPGSTWGTVWDAEDQTSRSEECKSSSLPTVLFPVPIYLWALHPSTMMVCRIQGFSDTQPGEQMLELLPEHMPLTSCTLLLPRQRDPQSLPPHLQDPPECVGLGLKIFLGCFSVGYMEYPSCQGPPISRTWQDLPAGLQPYLPGSKRTIGQAGAGHGPVWA